MDLSAIKTLRLAGQTRFELRLDVFNLFNWVNFSAPDRVVLSEPITLSMWSAGIGGPRTMQAGARILF